MTYNELVYMVLDELKIFSDDADFNEDHILFLLDKHRAFLLKQRYSDIKKQIPKSNTQTLHLNMETTVLDNKTIYKSSETIPDILLLMAPKITVANNDIEVSYTSNDRIKYVGNNKYLKNVLYCTTDSEGHLYIPSNRKVSFDIKSLDITAIYQNSIKASELVIDTIKNKTDLGNREFPIESALVYNLIELVVKELIGAVYRPSDTTNDADDNLSNLANYISRNLKVKPAREILG